MSRIRIANAPVSWGALEFEGYNQKPLPYDVVLDEIAETGYEGTELGDWGFMPTDPDELRAELDRRGLAMLGAFVPVRLRDPAALEPGIAHAVQVARLLAAVVPGGDRRQGPFIVIADDNATDPMRTLNAGRITPEMALPVDEWAGYAGRAEAVARAVREEVGLYSVFHHHSAGWVETPSEIERFLALTDPDLLGLIFDTGHYLFGAGESGPSEVEILDRWGDRIWYIHFKDADLELARVAKAENWDYFQALRAGIFSELGKGAVNFPGVVRWLLDHGYDGWGVVEQDILPGMGTPKESARRNRDYLAALGL
ncbi:MAG: TIM barrel protein [Thermomicrobiales bacterium]